LEVVNVSSSVMVLMTSSVDSAMIVNN
jgi:hypothetical protein